MASTWFGMERRLRFTMLRLFLFASFIGVALAGEWNCASTTGVFELSTDCTVSSEVVVTSSLNITGIPDANGVLPKIIGGGSNRLFKVESGGELVVNYLELTGGRVSENSCSNSWATCGGGALHVAGQLNVTNCVVKDNRAETGGGIICIGGSNCKIYGTTIEDNYAHCCSGGVENNGDYLFLEN